jgi:hypothetical protein
MGSAHVNYGFKRQRTKLKIQAFVHAAWTQTGLWPTHQSGICHCRAKFVWLDKHRRIMCVLWQKARDIFSHGDGGKARYGIVVVGQCRGISGAWLLRVVVKTWNCDHLNACEGGDQLSQSLIQN